jgi:glycosyltransferase involved in cell wall biosynthesis
MPPITALLHTENDARRLGRALEMLLPCDEVLIVDHHSSDSTRRVARQYGARIVSAAASAPMRQYLQLASHPWILCLQPTESISEGLQATLYEWKSLPPADVPNFPAFSFLIREETAAGWIDHSTPEARLVRRDWDRWRGRVPDGDPAALRLDGELLRFSLP